MIDPMRASTGTMQLSSYNPYDTSAGHYGYTPYPSDYQYPSSYSYDPHVSHERRLEALPVSSKTYRDPGHSTKLRTEYTVRPRQRSSTASGGDYQPTVRGTGRSSLDTRLPVITSGYGRSQSPLPPEPDRYLIPASSRPGHLHQGLYNTDYASDTGRLGPHHAVARHRAGNGAYRVYPPSGRKRYSTSGGYKKGQDIDDYDAYSYTTPREQFEKESLARMNYHRNARRRERPMSMDSINGYPQLSSTKESRELGPPPSQRGFDKVDRDMRARHSTHGSRDDGASHGTEGSRHLVPISVHQDDDGYSSYKEDHDDRYRRSHRNRRHDDSRTRYIEEDRAQRKRNTDPSMPGPEKGMGTATLAWYPEDSDYKRSRADPRHSRDPDHRRGRNETSKRESNRRNRTYQARKPRGSGRESDASTSDEDVRYKRSASARRRYDRSDSSSDKEGRSQYLTVEKPRRRRSSHSRHRGEDDRPSRVSSQQGSTSGQEDRSLAPDSPSVKESEAPPKGILKPPRDKFPEEPNPIREGVAPLKDAHKKGIPPGARWTKIDRRLVNPAALEACHERFEERPTCVIVLRVLTKEEIQVFAAKTQEIRGMSLTAYFT